MGEKMSGVVEDCDMERAARLMGTSLYRSGFAQPVIAQASAEARHAERSRIVARIRAWAEALPAPMDHFASELRELADEVALDEAP